MSNRFIIFIATIFAVGCMPTAKKQWVSTIKVKPNQVHVSKDFLDRVRANWYYNKVTKCYGVNRGFNGFFTYKEKGFDEVIKLNVKQFISIFGEPSFYNDSTKQYNYDTTMLYAYIDFGARAKAGYSPYISTPYVYSAIYVNQKMYFGKGDEDKLGYYDKKYNFKQLNETPNKAFKNCCKTESELVNLRNAEAKKVMSNYFFYCKQAGHYVLIDYAPFPSSCESKAEVIQIFGKPSKVESNGDLIYYLSLPNRYGNRNLMKFSPSLDNKYAVEVVIHD